MPLGGRNQRALLTLLLLRANEPVSSERLVNELWGEHPPRTATTSLQNTVVAAAEAARAGRSCTRGRPGTCSSSTAISSTSSASSGSRERRARSSRRSGRRLLREALALWRGPALADSELEDFAQAEIHRLEDLRLGVLEDRIAADLEVEVDSELVAEVESLVRRHPLRERLRAQLMLALYRSGRQADALSAYHDARRTLVDELGIEPGPELQALYGSILRQERSLVRVAPPALEDHYDEVLRAFSAGRLVPVLGPAAGGVAGHELAKLLAERFELDTGGRGLAYVSQAIAARNGIGPLHDELHLALDRDVEPSPLHAWLAGAAAAAPAPGAAAAADRLDGLRHGRRARVRSGRRGARRRRVRRGRPRPRQVPPHLARRRRRPSSTSRTPTPAWRWTSGASCSRSTATSTAAARASGRASRSARTITSTTSSATPPGRCRSSSPRASAAATCSSSATTSTTGACGSSSAASGEATGSRIARGRSSRPRSTSPASSGASAGPRSTTSRSRRTPGSSRG